jgi:hypothetical protein
MRFGFIPDSAFGFAGIPTSADNLTQAATGERAWLTIDEQFGNIALRQPTEVLTHNLHDIPGLAFDRKAARPRQHRPAIFTRALEGLSVMVQFVFR